MPTPITPSTKPEPTPAASVLTDAYADMDAARKRIADLEAQNAALAAKAAAQPLNRLTIRVSAKGAVSVYGLGRWPVTLYSSQWKALLNIGPKVLAFLAEHQGELAKDRE